MNTVKAYVIDDEPEIVELLCDVAEIAGLVVEGFVNAEVFFETVPNIEDSSILLLDLHMPEMDGIQVMRRLANMAKSPSLILISGHDRGVLHAAEKLGRAHNLNIVASLGKPVNIELLQQLLEQQCLSDKDYLDLDAVSSEDEIIADELYKAIGNNQLLLHYQPQIDLLSDKIIAVEALVRWQHPKLGLVFPDRFIPIAEQYGWMGKLTHWVIEETVQQEQYWQAQGFSIPVSVNISADNITSLTLPEQLAELLLDNRLDPTRITLEVTESMLMGELVTSLDILTRLRLKGIGLSIDDFGTGYSSLSQLHRVPFTELKIDRSFILNLIDDPEARAIVKTCIILGHELNMKVVAEGVETERHLEILKEFGCDRAQGYFFSRPVAADEIINLLKK